MGFSPKDCFFNSTLTYNACRSIIRLLSNFKYNSKTMEKPPTPGEAQPSGETERKQPEIEEAEKKAEHEKLKAIKFEEYKTLWDEVSAAYQEYSDAVNESRAVANSLRDKAKKGKEAYEEGIQEYEAAGRREDEMKIKHEKAVERASASFDF